MTTVSEKSEEIKLSGAAVVVSTPTVLPSVLMCRIMRKIVRCTDVCVSCRHHASERDTMLKTGCKPKGRRRREKLGKPTNNLEVYFYGAHYEYHQHVTQGLDYSLAPSGGNDRSSSACGNHRYCSGTHIMVYAATTQSNNCAEQTPLIVDYSSSLC